MIEVRESRRRRTDPSCLRFARSYRIAVEHPCGLLTAARFDLRGCPDVSCLVHPEPQRSPGRSWPLSP